MKTHAKLMTALVVLVEVVGLSLLFFSKDSISYTFSAPFDWFTYYYISTSFWGGIAIDPGALAINVLLLLFINKIIYKAISKRGKLQVLNWGHE